MSLMISASVLPTGTSGSIAGTLALKSTVVSVPTGAL